MAASVIALRFRDAIPGVDTIDAHRDVLKRQGAVWWGWWKKDFEEDHRELLNGLQENCPFAVFIVDRSTRRMFRAMAARVHIGNLPEEDCVPEYYSNYRGRVFAWFSLNSIDGVDFEDGVAARFGDHTLISLLDHDDNRIEKLASSACARDRSCILHLSDLHFGKDYAFRTQRERGKIGDLRRTLSECLLADLKRVDKYKKIAAVIVTGDFTTGGDWCDGTRGEVLEEFEELRSVLDLTREQIVAVPGNHDIIRYPQGSVSVDLEEVALNNQTTYQHEREFRTFVDELMGRDWKASLNYVHRIKLDEVDLLLCVLNSCTIAATKWTEYGFVGTSGLDAIAALESAAISRPTFKFVALHHHLLPVAGVEALNSKGVTLTLDASDLLDASQAAGAHVALHGHEHMPRIAKYQTVPLRGGSLPSPLHVISNGSSGGKRLPGSEQNAYCLFELKSDRIQLWMRELRFDGKEGARLFDGVLDSKPRLP